MTHNLNCALPGVQSRLQWGYFCKILHLSCPHRCHHIVCPTKIYNEIQGLALILEKQEVKLLISESLRLILMQLNSKYH